MAKWSNFIIQGKLFIVGKIIFLKIKLRKWRIYIYIYIKQAQKVYEVIFFDMQKCIYSESLLNTLYIEIKTTSFGQI